MPNWGAIVVGGIGGLCGTVVVVVPLLLSGLVDSNTFAGQAVVVLVGFAAQVLAGALASRVAGERGALHGAAAGLMLFGVLSSLSYVAGRDLSVGTVAFGIVVATILGTAGGVLVDVARQARPS